MPRFCSLQVGLMICSLSFHKRIYQVTRYHHNGTTRNKHKQIFFFATRAINKNQLINMKSDSENRAKSSQEISCLCGICGKVRRATVTRVNYTIFLFLVTILCFVLSVPQMKAKIDAIPHFCNEMVDSTTCDSLVGYAAVYRVCFGIAMFYLILSCVLVGVKSIDEVRARIHNGFWYIKCLLLIG